MALAAGPEAAATALEFWRAFDLDSKRPVLDQQALTMQQQVVLSNTQQPRSNKTIGFVVLTMGAFVLGVILTAGIGVWGMRRNRQVADNSGGLQGGGGGGGGGYQTVAGGEQ